MKILISKSIGGIEYSEKVFEALIQLGWSVSSDWEDDAIIHEHPKEEIEEFEGEKYTFRGDPADIKLRTNPELLQIIERLGDEAYVHGHTGRIIEIPDDIEFGIGENDMGYEWVYEKHRTWS